VTVEFKIMSGVTLEERDLTKALDELLKPTDPPEGAAVKNTTETPSPILLESISPRLPPEGQAMASIPFADGRSSMICASPVRTYSCSIGSHFATPCKNSNATSVHPIIGSSLPGQSLFPRFLGSQVAQQG
jgi:hypothetical protein